MSEQHKAATRGWFITVEGIDGAGKSSHIAEIAAALRAQGEVVCLTREPGGTPLGEALRTLLLHEEMDATSELLLAFASRRQHLAEVIVPALARGECVVCDRFTDATFAYQGAGRGVDAALIETLERAVQSCWPLPAPPAGGGATVDVLQPDCTLWFEVPPEVAAQRLQKARAPDRFEAQARTFFERVADGYAQRAAQYPDRFVRIASDADKPVVTARVLASLAERGITRAS